MKYIVVLGDGMADYPIKELDNKTPLMVANKPNIDALCKKGEIGLVKTVPAGFKPGSDVANLAVMGYCVKDCYSGRSPLEALSIGIDLSFNALFFDETIQEKNYESNGQISLLVTLPKVIFSCIGSVIISTVLSFLSSFAKKFNRLKKVTNKEKLTEEVASFMKHLKCKLIIYFTIVFVLVLFFWYFVIAFCAVYPKYQNMWLGDSAKSLVISMLFPFLFALVIVVLRYYAIKKKIKIMYRISNIINIV